jgi:CBS domain-containing protein
MRVEQLMSKDVTPCDAEDRLNDVAAIMWQRDCGGVPVVARSADGRVVAMITDRDICMAAYTTGRPLADLRVYEAMSRDVHTCRPGDTVRDAEAIMRSNQVRRLPVVDDAGNLAGILSLADLARVAQSQQGKKQPGISEKDVVHVLEAISAPHQTAAESSSSA